MGMDVYGKNPTSDEGGYFRNNVWWWRPLADYLLQTYPDLTGECTYWHTNDGDGLSAESATALADALQRDLDNGNVAAYAAAYAAAYEDRIAALPLIECTLCAGTGLRTDAIGRQYGYDVPHDPITGRGGCNGCQGDGKVQSWEAHYPFSVENVVEFAAFARASGGFEIH